MKRLRPPVLLMFALLIGSQHMSAGLEALTNQRIIELVQVGDRQNEIVRIKTTATDINFDLTPAATDHMLQAGVSEDIIKAMASQGVGSYITFCGPSWCISNNRTYIGERRQ